MLTAADGPAVDRCLLERYDEQTNGFKLELHDVSCSILSLDGGVSQTAQEYKGYLP